MHMEDEIRQGYISVQRRTQSWCHRQGDSEWRSYQRDEIYFLHQCPAVTSDPGLCRCSDAVYTEAEPYRTYPDHFSAKGGKTTLLRDVIRQLSNGREGISGVTVGVVDERSELAGSWQGVPQNDLGMRTDILDACPKAEGMKMLVRSMSPDVVAVDELYREEDFRAVESVIYCGCRLIATAHGNSLEDILPAFFQKLKKWKYLKNTLFSATEIRPA